MDIPSYQSLYKILHFPDTRHPTAIDGLLVMEHVGAWVEMYGTAFSDERDLPPFPDRTYRGRTTRVTGGTIESPLDAMAPGYRLDLRDIVFVGREHMVYQPELLGELNLLFILFNADEVVGPHRFAEHQSRQPCRPQSNHQYRVIAAYTHFLDRLVDSTETTGHLGSISVSQAVGKRDKILFIADNVFSHSAIALPTVGGTGRTGATDHETLPAFMADAATADMIDDDPVPIFELS